MSTQGSDYEAASEIVEQIGAVLKILFNDQVAEEETDSSLSYTLTSGGKSVYQCRKKQPTHTYQSY